MSEYNFPQPKINQITNVSCCIVTVQIAEVARLEKEVKTLHEAQVAAAKQTADVAVDGLPAAGGEDGKKTKSWYKFW